MKLPFLSTRFLRDESGAVTVDWVLAFAATVGMATVFGDKVVVPLIALGQQQAQLNAETVTLIEQAMAVCPAPVATGL